MTIISCFYCIIKLGERDLINNATLPDADRIVVVVVVVVGCCIGGDDFRGGTFGGTEILLFSTAGLFISSLDSSRLEQLFS